MKKLLLLPALGALTLSLVGCAMFSGPQTQPTQPPSQPVQPIQPTPESSVQGKAVSLRVLQERLPHASPEEQKDLLNVCGLTRIDAVVADTDPAHPDIILVGPTDGRPLHLEDLVLSLRSAFQRYAVQKGDTLEITPPAISIDPDPAIMAQLQQALAQGSGNSSHDLTEYKRIAASPQAVHVFGVSEQDRSEAGIAVAVDCDYNLKRLSNGSVLMDIPGWTDPFDQSAKVMRADPFASGAFSSFDRYWFTGGDSRFVEDEGVAVLKTCPVLLRTEAEALHNGRIDGTGKADKLALSFCSMVTQNYPQIAAKDPRYLDLQSVYRWMAWGEILHMRNAEYGTEHVLSYLLDTFAIPRTTVPEQLPGLSRVEQIQCERAISGGRETAYISHTSCGGVNLSETPNGARDTGGQSRTMAKQSISSRPSLDTLSWPVTLPATE